MPFSDPPARPVPPAVFLLQPGILGDIYSPEVQRRMRELVTVVDPLVDPAMWRAASPAQREAEVIFSGWGMPRMDEEFLDRFPRLRAVFYGAGSIRGFETPEMWERGIAVTSAAAANAVPVAEFTLSQILFCLKQGWQHALQGYAYREISYRSPPPGNYRSTVGLLSLGIIGRLVAGHLQRFDHRVLGYDPVVDPEQARSLGVELVPLERIFAECDVISCHTPLLPTTRNLLRGVHFAAMKPGATFLNTARGAVVNEAELCDVLEQRSDLFALLDVTHPEPPDEDSRLHLLPNVKLTHHIAGSLGPECRRLGQTMLAELERYLDGRPLLYGISPAKATQRA